MKKATDIDISAIDTSSQEFQDALKLISYTSQSVFLTGKAGTGKSTFLKYLTATTKKKYIVLAPTGIAAVNAGGQTLHSFFKLPFKPILPNDQEFSSISRLKARMRYSGALIKLIRSLDLIIIDEVSMVRADTIDFIDKILKTYTGDFRRPFGGKQLLLVGDVFQLEPVITGDTRDVLSNYYTDGMFFFNAIAFRDLKLVPIELTTVYRQSDSAFISMLDRIRCAQPLKQDIDELNRKVNPAASATPADFTMTLATRREIVDAINSEQLGLLKTPERVFTGVIKGDFPENALPTDKTLVLKEGAQVVFVKNDMERRWVNGTIGKVVDFGEAEIVVELENGTRHGVPLDRWANIRYEYDDEKKEVKEIEIGSFVQFPVKAAWALTIHKSQGLTFDRVILDFGHGSFSGGQSYVALSRCRSLEGITMRSTINARDIFVNPLVSQFSRHFNDQRLIQSALERAQADDLYHRAAMSFNRGDYSQAVELFAKAVGLRNELTSPNVVRLVQQKLHIIDRYRAELDEARKQLKAKDKQLEHLATEYVEMGETCRLEGWNIDDALANYNKAISLAPEYHPAWLGKGLALAAMNDIDGALSALDEAARLAPDDYRPLLEAGRLLVGIDDVVPGMDYLMRALEINERIAAIHSALADGYEKLGEDAKAAQHRKLARKLKR